MTQSFWFTMNELSVIGIGVGITSYYNDELNTSCISAVILKSGRFNFIVYIQFI